MTFALGKEKLIKPEKPEKPEKTENLEKPEKLKIFPKTFSGCRHTLEYKIFFQSIKPTLF